MSAVAFTSKFLCSFRFSGVCFSIHSLPADPLKLNLSPLYCREEIVQLQFNILVTTYEYLMNKNDRPRLSKVPWHYIIIDEGHRIKNASCKLNSELRHYQSNHRLLLTGTPIQVACTSCVVASSLASSAVI